MKNLRSHSAYAVGIVVLLMGTFACKPPQPAAPPPSDSAGPAEPVPTETAAAPQEKVPGDWFVENLSAEPGLLNPILDLSDAGGQYICNQVFDTLLKQDNETLEMKPNLAESWEVSDDHLTYTFKLRKDAKFSDGVPLTAQDVKFTLDLINDPKSDTAVTRNYLQDVTNVELIDDYTIKFTCVKPYFRHILVLGSIQPMPKHIYGTGDINRHPNNRNPIGCGPYVFERWDTGQQIVLTRNDGYWGDKPALDKHVFKFITDDDASFQVLERHEIDIMQFQPQMWVTRAATPQFEAEFNKFTPDSPIPGYLGRFGYIGWNMRKPQFADKRVRKALTMLLNRQQILDSIYKGLGTIIVSDCAPKEPEYNQNIKPLPFDPEAAVQLLEEAGWTDTNSDGIRDKDGVKFEFEFTFAVDVVEYIQMATVYQEELTRAGIKMTPRPLEWATFQARVQDRTFDACMLAWLSTYLYDPYQLWHSSQAEKGSNYPGFANDEADKILEDARTEFDRNKRIVMYHRFQEIVDDEQPYTYLWARYGLLALDKRFQGVKVYPAGLDPLEWWVPTAQQRYP